MKAQYNQIIKSSILIGQEYTFRQNDQHNEFFKVVSLLRITTWKIYNAKIYIKSNFQELCQRNNKIKNDRTTEEKTRG